MKVLIVEEALRTLHGHWYQYISDIVCGGQKAGHEIEVAVHQEACSEILQTLPCKPILRESVFESGSLVRSQRNALGRILRHNRLLFEDLAPILLNEQSDPYDVVIATTPRMDHLLAYQRIAMGLPAKSRLRFVMLMIESVGSYRNESPERLRFSPKTFPLRAVLSLFPRLPAGQRIKFATESTGLANQYWHFCGRRFSLLPHVTELPDLSPYRMEKSGEWRGGGLTFGTYGFTRYDKGLDILQYALHLLLARGDQRPSFNFIIQWTGDYSLPDGVMVKQDPILADSSRIRYIPAFHASDDYYHWIARTDVMVLPYRRSFYRDKLSRVAIDAALAGIPIIYPKGTWLEDFVMSHAAGVPFDEGNPTSLSLAIESCHKCHAELKELATFRMEKTALFFSARRFFDEIGTVIASHA
jgi:glycosyltransferase involved in cell wall biosynthesis